MSEVSIELKILLSKQERLNNLEINKINNLINTKQIDINAKYNCNMTVPYNLIEWASYKDYDSIVKTLIDNGANINSQDNYYGYTPIIYASIKNNLKTAKILIDNGADVNLQNYYYNYTPLMYACINNHIDIINLLLNAKNINIDIVNKYGKKAIDLTNNINIKNLLKNKKLLNNLQCCNYDYNRHDKLYTSK